MRVNVYELYSEIKELESKNNSEHAKYINILKKQFIDKVRKCRLHVKK